MTCMTVWHWPGHARWYDEGLRKSLADIASAGFTHINWNPDSGSPYVYARSEMDHIVRCIRDAGLLTHSIHASHGRNPVVETHGLGVEDRKDFTSPVEWQRLAGVDLLENRIVLAEMLGSPVLVLHVTAPDTQEVAGARYDSVRRSLDSIVPSLRAAGVRLAIENIPSMGLDTAVSTFDRLFAEYPADVVGMCYDSGHSNMVDKGGSTFLDRYADRIITTHLHDNFGFKDDHLLPGDGVIDWDVTVRKLAAAPLVAPFVFETPFDKTGLTQPVFYKRAIGIARDLELALAKARGEAQG